SDLPDLQSICQQFKYTAAPVTFLLRNSGSCHALSITGVVRLLRMPEDVTLSGKCSSALLEWVKIKYGSRTMHTQLAHDLQARMRDTFVAFSHLVSCIQIRRWHTRLLDEIQTFWFFLSIEPVGVVKNTLAIEKSFDLDLHVIEETQNVVTAPVLQRVLHATRKVVCDAYDEDPSLLRQILKHGSPFRFELLKLILDHRIEANEQTRRGQEVDAVRGVNVLGGGGFNSPRGGNQIVDDDPMMYAADGNLNGATEVAKQAQDRLVSDKSHSILYLSPTLREAGLIEQL
ncbi:unnamed protein product, partial [Amoebophrya sp. A25]